MSAKERPLDAGLLALRRKIYLEYHQDGLIDCLLGLGMIGFGAMLYTGMVLFNILAWLPLAFYVPIKNALTIPRFGYARFDSHRSRKWMLISLVVGVGLLALTISFIGVLRSGAITGGWQALLTRYHMFIVSGLLAFPLIAVSALTGLRRLLAYAGLIILVTGMGIELDLHPGLYFIGLGVTVLAIGLALLFRFLNRYPRQPEAANGG
ncbi:MAG TPA: hypothetical protein VLS48_02340 [Anaerolineales bacterium]|nr:hypothetical protein [Anaerolineales bacterium]